MINMLNKKNIFILGVYIISIIIDFFISKTNIDIKFIIFIVSSLLFSDIIFKIVKKSNDINSGILFLSSLLIFINFYNLITQFVIQHKYVIMNLLTNNPVISDFNWINSSSYYITYNYIGIIGFSVIIILNTILITIKKVDK